MEEISIKIPIKYSYNNKLKQNKITLINSKLKKE